MQGSFGALWVDSHKNIIKTNEEATRQCFVAFALHNSIAIVTNNPINDDHYDMSSAAISCTLSAHEGIIKCLCYFTEVIADGKVIVTILAADDAGTIQGITFSFSSISVVDNYIK
jgi:hypothetical protein